MLLASDDVGDTHVRVVHYGGEVVGGGAVGLADNEVPDPAERNLPPQLVPESTPTGGRPEVERAAPFFVLALVGKTGLRQNFDRRLVRFPAPALTVRALVEVEAQPGDVFELRLLEPAGAARPVGVLDAEDEPATVVPGAGPGGGGGGGGGG